MFCLQVRLLVQPPLEVEEDLTRWARPLLHALQLERVEEFPDPMVDDKRAELGRVEQP